MGRRPSSARIAVAAVLGIATTVATSWAFARVRPNGSGAIPLGSMRGANLQVSGTTYSVGLADLFGSSHVVMQEWLGGGMSPLPPPNSWAISGFPPATRQELPYWAYRPDRADLGISTPVYATFGPEFVTSAYGWPMVAMKGLAIEGPPGTHLFEHFIPMPGCSNPYQFCPTGVVPLGFLVDSLVFTAVWLAVLPVIARVSRRLFSRRSERRSRNECAGCGYSLAGLNGAAACPECGAVR